MKNIKLQFCFYLAFLSLIVVSCSKDNENDTVIDEPTVVKLLKAEVFYSEGGYIDSTAYFYSTDSLLYKAERWVKYPATEIALNSIFDFTYNAGMLIKVDNNRWIENARRLSQRDSIIYDNLNRPKKSYNLQKNESGVLVCLDSVGFEYNTNNLPYKFSYSPTNYHLWEYNGKNVSVIKQYQNNILRGDNEYYQYDNKVNPYKGNSHYFGKPEYYSANNWVRFEEGDGYNDIETRTYVYGSDGYPISAVWSGEGWDSYETIKFYY